MKKSEIHVGGQYLAKVSGNIVTVKVDRIREVERPSSSRYVNTHTTIIYDVVNLATGRRTTFRSAAKFRAEVKAKVCPQCKQPVLVNEDCPFGMHKACYERSNAAKLDMSLKMVMAQEPVETEDKLVEDRKDEDKEEEKEGSEDCPVELDPIDAETILHSEDVTDRLLTEEQDHDPFTHAPTVGETPTVTISVPTTVLAASTTPRNSATPTSNSIASQIAASRTVRRIGSLVAGMIPNQEQEDILAVGVESGLKVLVIGAGAGTGKTATLKMLEQVLPGRGQYTAFNSALVTESKAKFKKAACNTTHSLAFRAVGKTYQHRLGGERMRSGQIARILGIQDMEVKLAGQTNDKGEARVKHLSAEFLAGQVLAAIRRFCQSAERTIGREHIRYIDGIDDAVTLPDGRTVHGTTNNDLVRNYLTSFCAKAWEDLTQVDGRLPFNHDVYVKLWQLGEGDSRPIIAADYILLDEAQDTAPVFLDIIRRQEHALLIMVGDDNQQIYEWRGAVNAMATFPSAPRRLLSQSYRFGQAVADVANTILATLENPTDLVMRGNPTIPTRVAKVERPRCYLYRTNAGAISRLMREIEEGRKPHLIGGGMDTVAWCQAAIDLQASKLTRHPELCCFETWKEVQEYSKTDEGDDLRLMVKLIDDFGAETIRDALEDMPSEDEADVVISTAHKSKGREWDTVQLGQDFPTINRMNDADRRLLYVAATRAKLTLDVSDCPPFCGCQERTLTIDGTGFTSEWVPGLKIDYTQPMPTEEDLANWMASKSNPNEAATVATPTAPATSATTSVLDGNFTWASFNNRWCVRGPANVDVGTKVRVVKKNGSISVVTILSVVRRFSDTWIYAV